MKLPNGNLAIVPDDKLFNFLLNEGHATQRGHADLFHRLLGITATNAHLLRSALLNAAASAQATEGAPSQYGKKYEVRFEMTGARKVHTNLSVWMIENGQTVPRLVTAFVE